MAGDGSRRAPRRSGWLLAVAMVLVAANLRPAAASVGPVVDQIRDGLRLSSTAAGALLTLPVLCFGALAPAAGLLARRLGYERALAIAVAALTAGLAVRVLGGPALLFAGTALVGGAIATANVLMPVFVKRSFPRRAGLMSGLYVVAMASFASLAAGVTEPLSHALGEGWRGGLGIWAIPAALALLFWLPQVRGGRTRAQAPVVPALHLLRDPIARQLMIYFGLQSASFYAMLSWLPSILTSHGIDPTTAGLLLAVSTGVGLPFMLIVPTLAARSRDQRALAVGFTLVTAIGCLGLLVAPAAPLLWAVLIGTGQGACFPLALTLIVLRSGNVTETASLSTLVQTGGYLFAATVPIAAGALHDLTGTWGWTLVVLVALSVPQATAALIAGRDRVVGA